MKASLAQKYSLPTSYLLYVGTIEPRKNLLKIVEAINIDKIDIPLVVIGRPTGYLDKVRKYIADHSMENIIFLRNVPNDDLPGLYQMAEAFIYPSSFEGFGIPILEALSSRTPVVTTRGGCFHEAGGESSIYVDPGKPEEIAASVRKILENSEIQESMRRDGYEHAIKFREEFIAKNIMEVYLKTL
jgi:glycosyltransferase involved in cell wall biosynthesis